LGLTGFAVSATAPILRPGDDVEARSAGSVAHGMTWALADPGAGANDAWLARVDPRLAVVLVVDADRSKTLARRVERAATARGGLIDGVLLRDSGRVPQERAWPAIAELVADGITRCGGLVTSHPAVVERCTAWHRVDAVLLPAASAASSHVLFDICRWSGITVLLAEATSVRAGHLALHEENQ
jgi:hypothetical protein